MIIPHVRQYIYCHSHLRYIPPQEGEVAKQESSRDWLLHHRHCGLWEHWDSDTKWVQLGGIWRFLFRASGLRPLDEDVALRVWRRRKTTRIETKIRRPKPIFSRWQFSQVTSYCGWLHPETERPKVKPSHPLFYFFVTVKRLKEEAITAPGFSCVVKVVS